MSDQMLNRIWNPSQLRRMTLKTQNYSEDLSDLTSMRQFSADRSINLAFHIPRSYSEVQAAGKVYIIISF